MKIEKMSSPVALAITVGVSACVLAVVAHVPQAAAAAPSPSGRDSIPLELAQLEPVADHQLVVFRDCRGDVCLNTFHLRKVEMNGVAELICKAPIAELNRGAFQLDAITPVAGGDALLLRLVEIRNEESLPAVTRTLTVSGNCRYTLAK
ncbi:hypothetical protein [Lysobacter sp. HA18]